MLKNDKMTNKHTEIELKFPLLNPDEIHCKEFETNIEDIIVLKKIFENLDFKEIIVIEKLRSIWTYKGVKIAVVLVNGIKKEVIINEDIKVGDQINVFQNLGFKR